MKRICVYLFTVCILIFAVKLFAHPGRTDSSGGHTDRKTGTYHYHNSGSSSSSSGTTYTNPSTSTENKYTPSNKSNTSTTTSDDKPSSSKKSQTNKPITVAKKHIVVTEYHWKSAINNKIFKGKLETNPSTGKVYILTDTQVIEVLQISKYQEGVEQVLQNAKETSKKPILVLYIDGDKDGYELIQKASALCKEKDIIYVLGNSYVSINELIELASGV